MKKVENVLIILLLTILILPINVEARTLKDYKNDFNDLIKQKETAQKNEMEMQKQIDKANEEIEEITKKIKENRL